VLHLQRCLLKGGHGGDALVFGAFGVQQGNKHFAVAFSFGRIGTKDLANSRRR
jgi:hypothetical protein